MDMPSIHMCSKLTEENQRITRKLKKLRRRNAELERQLTDINDKLKLERVLKEYVTTRNTAVQTEPPGYQAYKRPVQKPTAKKNDPQSDENERINKILSMHNHLMRRYEKEVKTNADHIETIAALNLRIHDLEQNLSAAKQRIKELERKSPRWSAGRKQRRRSASLDNSLDLRSELETVRKERNKLAKDKKKLKKELQGLDEGFFDEIEDLKFALQQSAKLNQQYDRTLRNMCRKFKVPFPFSEHRTSTPV
ncbi:centrosomal protein of 290 kDa-like [Ptychodera flava]|uniref:centrosomal protein of 290 kDa-like n=1 Tax=Ptychodera flava TaxID=63121 RepID=UPI00396AA74B